MNEAGRRSGIVVALWAITTDAWGGGDGAYGRVAADTAVSGEVGVAYNQRTTASLQGRALYLATAGFYGTVVGRTSSKVAWSAGAGIELRPLFLPRFLLNLERGPATADLLIDSLSLRIGVRHSPDTSASLELGSGLEVPLTTTFDGPFVGVQASFVLSPRELAAAQSPSWPSPLLLQLTVGWRTMLKTHLVDAGDRTYR